MVGAVAKRKHLIQPVTDVNDTNALPAQVPYNGEEPGHFPVGKRRRRFIHDHDSHAMRERLGNLDQLLFRHAQGAAGRFKIEFQSQAFEKLPPRALFARDGKPAIAGVLLAEKKDFRAP